jgi:hypothetical protein
MPVCCVIHKYSCEEISYYSNLLLNTDLLVDMILIICDVYLDSQDNSVSIALGYRLDGRGLIPSRRDFSPLHSIHIGSGAHPASCVMGGFFIWFVRPSALSPLLAYCASLG